MHIRGISSVVAFAVTATGASIVSAAPASAGCEMNFLTAVYCDGPIQADGTWQRCWTTDQQFYGTYNGGLGVVPAMHNCYQVNPAVPWPAVPIGQPHYRINP